MVLHSHMEDVENMLTKRKEDIPISNLNEEDFVCINVCGMKYQTFKSTLERFPCTLLGNQEHRKNYYDKSKNLYFFDRHRQSFEAILYYYQSGGLLIRPQNIPLHLFAEEVSFYCLGKQALLNLQENEGFVQDHHDRQLPVNYWQRRIWETLEFPDSSFAARIVASWSILIIIVSIFLFCMETLPTLQDKIHKQDKRDVKVNNSNHVYDDNTENYLHFWFSLELGCVVWFAVEYTIRLISSPNKRKFFKSFLNFIDLVAILPYFIILTIHTEHSTPLSVLRVVRLIRVFRIFKLSRHSLGLQIIGHTLKASVNELGMLAFFLMVGVILFSSAIYYAEHEQNQLFSSIPDAFWYSLVTMTTVGYGDIVPKTCLGKLIGSVCAVSGVLTIAMVVPVIVSNFEFFYKMFVRYNDRILSPSVQCSSQKEELLSIETQL